MAVNGGGAVTLQFQRSPLRATTRTAYLPWNRIVVVSPVVMTPSGDEDLDNDGDGGAVVGSAVGWFEEEDFASKVI